MSDPVHDSLADRLRSLGAQMPAPTLPAAEIRRRADRRRQRRHALGATAACTAVALCLVLPSALRSPGSLQSPGTPRPSDPRQSPGPQQGAVATDASSAPASPYLPAAFTVTSTATTPIDAGAVAAILSSCLGPGSGQYHPVISVRAPVASSDTDGVVVAVDSAGQYVQCESKGTKGTSQAVPATFINDRLWGAGHLIEFFQSFSTRTGAGQFLSLGAGHYTPDVAKVTISYGDDPTQYPAVMAGGAFVHTAAITTGRNGSSGLPGAFVHAYDTDGKEIYNQKTQPAVGR